MDSPTDGSPFSPGLRVFALAAADFDGDGAVDLVAAGGDRVVLLAGQPGKPLPKVCCSDLPQGKAWMARVADVDRDGRPDIIAPDPSNDVVSIWR